MKTLFLLLLSGLLLTAAPAFAQFSSPIVKIPIAEGQSRKQIGHQGMMGTLREIGKDLISDGNAEQAGTKRFLDQTVNLHRSWYDGLQLVSSAVRDYKSVARIFNYSTKILRTYERGIQHFRSDRNLTPAQLQRTVQGYSVLMQGSAKLLDELSTIMTPRTAQMTDAQRIKFIDRIEGRMREQYNLVDYFTRRNMAVSSQQAQAAQDRQTRLALYTRPN